jgi:hypothetical protein
VAIHGPPCDDREIVHPRAHGLSLALSLTCCGSDGFFVCADSEQCGARGLCEADGACSFPDLDCDSGRRYGKHGDPDRRGECVSSTATSGATDPSPGSGSSAPGTSAGNDTLALDEGTATSAATTSIEPPGGDTSGTTGPGSRDDTSADSGTGSATTGEPVSAFFDDFERADADAIGNGWWEKTPGAFELVAGEVARTGARTGYPDNLVLRPAAEIQRDVEITMVVRPILGDPPGNPQIHARVQEADHDVADSVTGYILFIDNESQLIITRQEAAVFATTFGQPVVPLLVAGAEYRLRLVISGEDPVQLDGYLEVPGPGGTWVLHTEVHVTDSDPTRITMPGYLGFSAHTELMHFTYDDFAWTELP